MAEDYEGEQAEHWRAEYRKFIETIQKKYPKCEIILTTTILNHDAAWDRAIGQVAEEMKDKHVHHFLYTNNGSGTHGHIRIPEAEKMAKANRQNIVYMVTSRLKNDIILTLP